MNRLYGLYAITPEVSRTTPPMATQVEQAIAGGARLIQYRNKGGDPAARLREASFLLMVCRAAAVPLIVNDDLDLAARIGADGVHLGRDDSDPREARRRLGPEAIIGVSCYNQIQWALRAQEIGADYVAFGRFFSSTTKPLAIPATPTLLRRAREQIALPLVAIGGITPENGHVPLAVGADMLAAVDAVFGQSDIRAAAAAFDTLFHAFHTNEASPQTDEAWIFRAAHTKTALVRRINP